MAIFHCYVSSPEGKNEDMNVIGDHDPKLSQNMPQGTTLLEQDVAGLLTSASGPLWSEIARWTHGEKGVL